MSGIIVGADGSRHSERALEWALREAAFRQVPLTVLTAYQAAVGYWGDKPGYPEESKLEKAARLTAQEQTDKALSQIGDRRPPAVTVRTVHGLPAEELMSAALGADMIVVAARGTGGFARLLLGSVGTQLTHHAQCPVVIVPPEDRMECGSW
jgi:nucleotide-binding universal stress UspA family protein